MAIESKGHNVVVTIDQPLTFAEMRELLAALGLRLATPEEIGAFMEGTADPSNRFYTLTDLGIMSASE